MPLFAIVETGINRIGKVDAYLLCTINDQLELLWGRGGTCTSIYLGLKVPLGAAVVAASGGLLVDIATACLNLVVRE